MKNYTIDELNRMIDIFEQILILILLDKKFLEIYIYTIWENTSDKMSPVKTKIEIDGTKCRYINFETTPTTTKTTTIDEFWLK